MILGTADQRSVSEKIATPFWPLNGGPNDVGQLGTAFTDTVAEAVVEVHPLAEVTVTV